MIRKAILDDLQSIMDIVAKTIILMRQEGNSQWNEDYPTSDVFSNDISTNSLYVYSNQEIVRGFICINMTSPNEYANACWNSDAEFIVLHRLAVHPDARKQGVGSRLLRFAEDYAKKKGISYIRTDTNNNNVGMNALFEKFGYTKVSEIRLRDLSVSFSCYDKILI